MNWPVKLKKKCLPFLVYFDIYFKKKKAIIKKKYGAIVLYINFWQINSFSSADLTTSRAALENVSLEGPVIDITLDSPDNDDDDVILWDPVSLSHLINLDMPSTVSVPNRPGFTSSGVVKLMCVIAIIYLSSVLHYQYLNSATAVVGQSHTLQITTARTTLWMRHSPIIVMHTSMSCN